MLRLIKKTALLAKREIASVRVLGWAAVLVVGVALGQALAGASEEPRPASVSHLAVAALNGGQELAPVVHSAMSALDRP